MRNLRGWVITAVLVASAGLVGAGCSSSGSGGGGGGGNTCSHSSDCTKWQCACNDGFSISVAECINHACADSQQACGGTCDSHGGLKSANPVASDAGAE